MKIMLISDIHLRDYHRFNKFPNQRLYSFIELAKDIVKIGEEQEVDVMLIGGDIVDKNTLSPMEIHALFSMFTILAKHFRIYSIIGNHDAKSKKSIDKNDTVITLLEELDNISFHHREILEIGGRKIAFENWVPEYDLQWVLDSNDGNPVDLYMSHATIDYDNTGIYGMDTSVFDDKFTLGVFGDIHVTRQLGNLVSIGNTKQESLSDRDQGGVMIMDLDDLSYERIPIDPEHKKYLHLEKTEDVDEEGWVDFEGESMVYKVFKPKKVKSKEFTLELPKVTDIDVKTDEVMKSQNLSDLHKSIKSECSYSPVDFNFNLNWLQVKNFRSIDNYTLDFSNNYVITGHTGSGKSTLITALFYALIGKKTLKKDIKYGETECQLKVSLDYQSLTYVITRGTSKGDFGLQVGDNVLKFNSKLEFEKSVIEHLPFLQYHESFFFNYWDTELLGNLKVDRRYDLLSKYYRLDSLSSYNDLAEARLKLVKKEYKIAEEELSKIEYLRDSKFVELEALMESLETIDSEKELKNKLSSHTKYLEIEKSISQVNEELEDLKTKVNSLKESFKAKKSLIDSLRSKIKNNSLEAVKTALNSHSEFKTTQERVVKGDSYIDRLKVDLTNINVKLDSENSKLESLGIEGEEPPYPTDLENELEELLNLIDSKTSKISKEGILLDTEENSLKTSINALKSSLKELEASEESSHCEEVCSSCKQVISWEFKKNEVKKDLEEASKKLSELELKKSKYIKSKKSVEHEVTSLKESSKEKQELISSIKAKISRFKELSIKRDIITSEINSLSSNKLKLESDIEKFSTKLDELKSDLKNHSELTEEEYLDLNSDLRNLLDLESETSTLDSIKSDLEKSEEDFQSSSKGKLKELKELESSLSYYKKLSVEDLNSCMSGLSLHSQVKSLSESCKKLDDSVEDKKVSNQKINSEFEKLTSYCQLTSRSGEILKSILEELTKTFSSPNFKFTTAKIQASGKVVTDMSVSYLVGKKWIPYDSLSSGQRTLCDLYYVSKIVTGVGIVSFDETLRFLDEETLKTAVDLIDNIKKNNLLISTHSSNLSMEGTMNLKCELFSGNTTNIELVM